MQIRRLKLQETILINKNQVILLVKKLLEINSVKNNPLTE